MKFRGTLISALIVVILLSASFFYSEKSAQAPVGTETAQKPEKIEKIEESIEEKNVQEAQEEPRKMPTVEKTEKEMYCTLSIRCDKILENMDLLPPEKHALIPENGIILFEKNVTFSEGESVFDVLLRETREKGIHFEYVNTPVYDSAYIEGINNLYEFDCGELSGWMYSVNGWFPNYGCSGYQLKAGDSIEWLYTCDLGRDIGDNSMK